MKKKIILGMLLCSFMSLGIACSTEDSKKETINEKIEEPVKEKEVEARPQISEADKEKFKIEGESKLEGYPVDSLEILTSVEDGSPIFAIQVKTDDSDLESLAKDIEEKLSDLGTVDIQFIDSKMQLKGIFNNGSLLEF